VTLHKNIVIFINFYNILFLMSILFPNLCRLNSFPLSQKHPRTDSQIINLGKKCSAIWIWCWHEFITGFIFRHLINKIYCCSLIWNKFRFNKLDFIVGTQIRVRKWHHNIIVIFRYLGCWLSVFDIIFVMVYLIKIKNLIVTIIKRRQISLPLGVLIILLTIFPTFFISFIIHLKFICFNRFFFLRILST